MTNTIDTTTRPGILESDESQTITRYYIRLARHITRSLQAHATQPNQFPPRRAVTYRANRLRAAGTQAPNGRADQHRRTTTTPFRRTSVVASRWILGTEEEADNFISRINEHGIDVKFVDEQIE